MEPSPRCPKQPDVVFFDFQAVVSAEGYVGWAQTQLTGVTLVRDASGRENVRKNPVLMLSGQPLNHDIRKVIDRDERDIPDGPIEVGPAHGAVESGRTIC
jgi:hypothetical protein